LDRKQKPLPLVYKAIRMEVGYRLDLVIENKVIVEIKSVDYLNDIHMAQVLTYLKILDLRLGLLMNFNVLRMKEGIKRVVNNI
jgi:GxxExxY protein